MKFMKFAAALVTVGFLAACAQQEEPAPVVVEEPEYDKYGNVVED
ncbi:MAG: hypothetical protein HLUCCO07_02530 [Rhodobacteraceae bacterium HLUCCO07]|nr:MAG: hypothetical protein HLUCCO07_02530 [Rhodobacteraceae bacterium HLUCCO07]